MAFRKIPPVTWLLYAVTLVVIFIIGPEIFHRRGDVWIGAGLVLLVLAVPVVAYLCRPSVRAELPLSYMLLAARLAVKRGDYDRAEELCRKAVARSDALRANRDLSLGMALSQLGDVLRVRGRLTEAEPFLRRCLSILERVVPEHGERITRMEEHAALLRNLGRPAEADEWETKAKQFPV